MDQNYIIDTLKGNINRQSALDVLMDVERVLDNQNIYTYANWIDGEVVEGPHIDKYWVTVTLMYEYEKMPDPEAAKRLLKHDCKVYYAKDVLISAAKLKDPSDSEPRDGMDGRRPGQGKLKERLLAKLSTLDWRIKYPTSNSMYLAQKRRRQSSTSKFRNIH